MIFLMVLLLSVILTSIENHLSHSLHHTNLKSFTLLQSGHCTPSIDLYRSKEISLASLRLSFTEMLSIVLRTPSFSPPLVARTKVGDSGFILPSNSILIANQNTTFITGRYDTLISHGIEAVYLFCLSLYVL